MPMFRILTLFICGLIAFEAQAASNNAVLPRGVWHPSVRIGSISEVSNKFDNSGSLQGVGRLNQAMTGVSLTKQTPELKSLENYLNQTYPNSHYADQLSVGNLEFEANAIVNYTAPVLAYGVSKRLTVGVGLPIATIHAEVEATQSGVNNAAAVRSQIAADMGPLNPQLDNGFTQLQNVKTVQAFQAAMTKKGYIVPTTKNETVVGDLQLAGVYQYYENRQWTLYQQTTLNLPTGPEDNPDDFLDIPSFHQTYTKFVFNQDYRILPSWTLGTQLGYIWKLPDTAEKRVPKDESDILPDADRKERVARDLGDMQTVGLSTKLWVTRVWQLNTGWEYTHRGQDRYSGARGYNYGLLSRDSEGIWHKVMAGVTFSTIDLFTAQEFAVPFEVAYQYSDIIWGINTDRQLTHELALKMFF